MVAFYHWLYSPTLHRLFSSFLFCVWFHMLIWYDKEKDYLHGFHHQHEFFVHALWFSISETFLGP